MSGPAVSLGVEMPRADEAESAVLGAVLANNALLADVATVLQPESFRTKANELVYRAMLSLARTNQPIDFITVKNELGDAAAKEVGVAHLAKLPDGVPRAVNIGHYAKVVLDHWRRREAIRQAIGVIEAAVEAGAEADDVIGQAQEAFFRLAQTKRQETLYSAEAMTRDLMRHLEEITDAKHTITGLQTGIAEFDQLSFGLQPGELVVLGARPGVGKTAWALQVAMHMASQSTGLFCSMEMGHRSVWKRALFNTARVNGFDYLRGRLNDPGTNRRIANALNSLSPLPLWLDEQAGMTSIDIRSKAQQVQLRHGLGFLVVDYLQLMRPADPKAARNQSRAQVVGEMARDLKEIAMSLKVPVIVLSGLRRLDGDKVPSMDDLRESGDIEAHADIVLLLHCTDSAEALEQMEPEAPTHMDLIIAKQRGNPTGVIKMLNFREQYRFESATSLQEPRPAAPTLY